MKRLLLVLLAGLCAGRSLAAGLDERQQKILGVDRPAHPAFQNSTLPEWETSASGPLRPAPSFGSYYSATNLVSVWGGYTLGAQRNGYNDNLFLSLSEPTHELTVLSWLAIHDASGNTTASGAFVVEGSSFLPRGSDVIPSFYYSPNLEPAAPDLLGGSWGWGTNAVSFSETTSFDYGFPAGGVTFTEYTESTGNQYVDTGIVPSSGWRAVVDFSLAENVGTGIKSIFGQRTSSSSSDAFSAFASQSGIWPQYRNSQSQISKTVGLARHVLEIGASSFFDGELLRSNNGSFSGKYAIYVFAKNQAGSWTDRPFTGRIYSLKIWNASGVLVCDLRPVKDAFGVAGMLDMVSGTILHSETSTALVAGPTRDPTNELERCYTLAWNGGPAGTNAFPHGVYTVAWTNLSSAMTLSVGGESVELAAGSGNRNALPGSGTGFVLSGTGTGSIGISRRKVEPYYSTGRGGPEDTSDAAMKAFNAKIVSTNWCLVAHRVRLDDSVHTNDISIVQRDGSLFRDGVSCELPPDGTRALQTNGWYQFVYQAIGTMSVTYVYEWNRRVYDRWLSDAEIRRAFEDDLRFRDSLGYETYVHSNAIYGTEPARVDLGSVDPLLPSSRNWYRAWLAATNPPAATPGAVAVDALVLPVGITSPIRDGANALVEVLVAEPPMLKALVQRYRSGLAPTNVPVNLAHSPTNVVGAVADLWWVEGEGVWARLLVPESVASAGLRPSCEILGLRAQATDAWGTWGDFWLPWQIRGVALVERPALATPVVYPSAVPASPYPGVVRP